MPDTKISGLTAAGSVADANEFAINEAGTSKKVTGAQIRTFVGGLFFNQSTAAQGAGFAADTYLTGSSILLTRLPVVGTRYYCMFNVVKTAAGVATPILSLRFGTAGTTADTARCTLTFAAQTAVIDEGLFEVWATFRTVGSGTSGVLQAHGGLQHRLSITGLSTDVAGSKLSTSAGFDTTVANSIIGLSVNGGTSAAWTVSLVQATAENI